MKRLLSFVLTLFSLSLLNINTFAVTVCAAEIGEQTNRAGTFPFIGVGLLLGAVVSVAILIGRKLNEIKKDKQEKKKNQ